MIVGANGLGKTTLLKMMAGELKPDKGSIRLGTNVLMGYYAQHHTDLLHPRRTILEEVWQEARQKPESFIRGVCGAFLFSNDTVEKPIAVLSGGERARVLLARLLVNPGNLLLMDEPTNHLDLAAAEALAEALAAYDGTLVFISHNLSFTNRLATKVWEVSGQRILEYPGNLSDYARQKERVEQATIDEAAEKPKVSPAKAPPSGRSAQSRREQKRSEAEARNKRARQVTPIKRELAKLEERIGQLEAAQKEREKQLADPDLYAKQDQFREVYSAFDEARTKLEELYARWQHKQEELDRIND